MLDVIRSDKESRNPTEGHQEQNPAVKQLEQVGIATHLGTIQIK